jgi:exodeoxyribonuclease VII large subunit
MEIQTQKLSKVMTLISETISKTFTSSIWVECEIASISKHSKSQHWYLELVELDPLGNEVCKVKANIWKFKSDEIMTKFKNFTGSDLASGMKILINATPSFHSQYHLSFVINDIKPEFTLGGIEAKINQIVKELKDRKEYSKNISLQTPSEFTKCAVIAPSGAAGLGDFKKEADILVKYNICDFDYYEAIFQGKEASDTISEKIKDIVFSEKSYDCIILIRGGGAKTDLHFLNDIKIARFVCRSPIPVFVGIGHERDQGVLDLISNKSFDTPSKVIEYISSTIFKNANDINKTIALIEERASQKVEAFKSQIELTFERVSNKIKETVQKNINDVEKINNLIRENTNTQILKIENYIEVKFSSIVQNGKHYSDRTKENINRISNEVVLNGIKKIENDKKTILSNFGLINAFRPSYILDFGFVMMRQNKKLLSNAKDLKDGDSVQLETKDMYIDAIIKSTANKGDIK